MKKTIVYIGEQRGEIKAINLGIAPNGGRLCGKVSKEVSKIKKGCFNCIHKEEIFFDSNNLRLKNRCDIGFGIKEINYSCINYEKDKKGSKKLKKLKLNFFIKDFRKSN